jgi:uncharacterized protein YegP (UPF0339 family)
MIFNRKFWKMVKWVKAMKKKHNTYSFKLLCSGHELIIYVEGSESKDDEFRMSIL